MSFVNNLNAGNVDAACDLVAENAVFILYGVGVVEGKAGEYFHYFTSMSHW